MCTTFGSLCLFSMEKTISLQSRRYSHGNDNSCLIELCVWHLRCAVSSPSWRPWTSWKLEMLTPSAITTKLFRWLRSGRLLRTAWAAWAHPRHVFLRPKTTLTGNSSTRLWWSYWCIMDLVRDQYGHSFNWQQGVVYMHHVGCLLLFPLPANDTKWYRVKCIARSRLVFNLLWLLQG